MTNLELLDTLCQLGIINKNGHAGKFLLIGEAFSDTDSDLWVPIKTETVNMHYTTASLLTRLGRKNLVRVTKEFATRKEVVFLVSGIQTDIHCLIEFRHHARTCKVVKAWRNIWL